MMRMEVSHSLIEMVETRIILKILITINEGEDYDDEDDDDDGGGGGGGGDVWW